MSRAQTLARMRAAVWARKIMVTVALVSTRISASLKLVHHSGEGNPADECDLGRDLTTSIRERLEKRRPMPVMGSSLLKSGMRGVAVRSQPN